MTSLQLSPSPATNLNHSPASLSLHSSASKLSSFLVLDSSACLRHLFGDAPSTVQKKKTWKNSKKTQIRTTTLPFLLNIRSSQRYTTISHKFQFSEPDKKRVTTDNCATRARALKRVKNSPAMQPVRCLRNLPVTKQSPSLHSLCSANKCVCAPSWGCMYVLLGDWVAQTERLLNRQHHTLRSTLDHSLSVTSSSFHDD